MQHFYTYGGRGQHYIAPEYDKQILEPDPGTVFLITENCHGIEFNIAYCRSIIIDRWTCYASEIFKRAYSPTIDNLYAEYMDDGMFIFNPVEILTTEELPWMKRRNCE